MTGNTSGNAEKILRDAQALHRTGRLEEARALCLRSLQSQPRQPGVLILLGIIAAQMRDLQRAVALFDQALQLDPRSFAAHNNRGNALLALGQPAAAAESYAAAIALEPKHAPTHNNRGKALFALGQHEAAIASHEAAIELKPDYAAAHLDRAVALLAAARNEDALISLEKAIVLAPGNAAAWYLRGSAQYGLGRFEAALQSYDRALALKPGDARAWHNRGNALAMLSRYEAAIASYDKAIALDPGFTSSRGERLHARMHIADWHEFESEVAWLTARIERNEVASNPFVMLALCGSATLQRRAAQNWVRSRYPPSGALPALPVHSRRQKIRIGYFSAEFHGHATASLTSELFEVHDRSKFELTAFSLGPDSQDASRRRLEAAFDRFLKVRAFSDLDIARLARDLEIDIAVDLGGFTRGGRPGIFALRAAPVQVSYLGYLGTMSAEYIDYLIADDVIIPASFRQDYCEKIVYLPSYQVNDSQRCIAPRRFSREELGLPPAGFVFCCFNSTYKITPDTFGSWMRILDKAPESVLFLLGESDTLQRNLKREARERGIDADRLVFGGRLPPEEYLARYRTADLFLDTLPYNAGTTASDALWAGLPVLTCMGATFAGRVGASLLTAVGLPELITSTPEHYERLAVELSSNERWIADIRAKLAGDLRATPLFDTAASARHLEAAYARMVDRYHAGLPPEHIRVDA